MTRLVRIVAWLIAVGLGVLLLYAVGLTGALRNFPVTLFWIVGVVYLTWWALRAPIEPARQYNDKWERRARAKEE